MPTEQTDEYQSWLEENEDELWAAYNECGACAEGADYEDWAERQYMKTKIHAGKTLSEMREHNG